MSILKQQGQRMLDKKWAFHFAAVTIKNWEYIIDGNDVMQSLGLSPGPVVGELLEALREARAAGEITGRAQALKYLKRLYQERAENT